MKHHFSIIMLMAAVGFSLLYLATAKKTGLVAAQAEMSFVEPAASVFVEFSQADTEGLQITSKTNEVYYCLITEVFLKKLSSYGATAADFLSLSQAQPLNQETTLTTTSGFTVMNYLKANSETLRKGKTYYLFLGTKNAANEFTNEQTECIRIQL